MSHYMIVCFSGFFTHRRSADFSKVSLSRYKQAPCLLRRSTTCTDALAHAMWRAESPFVFTIFTSVTSCRKKKATYNHEHTKNVRVVVFVVPELWPTLSSASIVLRHARWRHVFPPLFVTLTFAPLLTRILTMLMLE